MKQVKNGECLLNRLERFCMGKFQMQELTKTVAFKDVDTYKEQLLFYNFAKFGVVLAAPRPQMSKKRTKNSKNSVF
jgi:hypothetical protein